MPFVKLDCGILNSTLWFERTQRELFITALLMAEPRETTEPLHQIATHNLEFTGWVVPPGWYGFVPAAGVGILHRAGITDTDSGMAALDALAQPEASSRSKDFDGRRLVRVDGGFIILNYMKYRERDYTGAERARRYRQRKESRRDNVTSRRDITQAEAEAEAESRSLVSNNKLTPKPEIVPPASGGGKKARPLYRNERFAVHQWQIDELLSMLGHQAEQFDLHEWLLVGAVKAAKAESGVVGDWWKWLRAETLKEAQRRGFQMASIAVSGNKQIEGLIEGGKRFLEMQRGRV